MTSRPVCIFLLTILLLAGCAAPRSAVKGDFDMPYPPPAPLKAEEIYHVPTGLNLSFDGMMDMLAGVRLVCIGETHDNIHAHRVELLIIRELFRRYPGKVAIGMEMFREPTQGTLDRWTKGELTELEFLKATKWYEDWGSDFGYYRDILAFAKENGIDVIALNPSRELQQEVSRTGLDNLAGSVKAKLPEIGEPDPFQKAVMKGVYGAHLPTEGMFESFFRVQLLWEETMAVRVVDYLGSPRGEGKRMVTITGGWHVRYGFGIPKKAIRRMPMTYSIVEPEEIGIPEEKKDQIMEVDLPQVPLHPADFVWMVPYEGLEGKQVAMGVRLVEGKDNEVLVEGVTPGSPAEKAGILKGDRIVSFDGRIVSDVTDVFLNVREKKAGDKATVVVRKDGADRSVEVEFFPLTGKKHHE